MFQSGSHKPPHFSELQLQMHRSELRRLVPVRRSISHIATEITTTARITTVEFNQLSASYKGGRVSGVITIVLLCQPVHMYTSSCQVKCRATNDDACQNENESRATSHTLLTEGRQHLQRLALSQGLHFSRRHGLPAWRHGLLCISAFAMRCFAPQLETN